MLLKILIRDFKRNKTITIALFIFVMLAVLLASSGTNIIMQLFSSIDNLFAVSDAPHFVQMHSGAIDQAAIDTFVAQSKLVKSQQTSEMLVIDNASIFYGDTQTADESNVMDNGFVTQSKGFDFLLNLQNERIAVSSKQIAVPVSYMMQKNLNIGDQIRISTKTSSMSFTITDFVRDALMNPSIISSKRFVVSDHDLEALKSMVGEIEYLIEFKLNDLGKLNEFSTAYQSSDLPGKGPAVDHSLFRLSNALSDGMVATVIFLVSLLLILVAVLCLRFTILTTLEEDYREIGVMKAIGISEWNIKKVYLTKYMGMAAVACICGYLLSMLTSHLFTSNITLYIGATAKSAMQYAVPALAAALVFLIVLLSCTLVLRRFKKITAVEALRSGTMGESKVNTRLLPLHKSGIPNVNLFLGLKDICGRYKMYLLLFFIFVICSFITIVPVNLLSTMQSPSVVSYMGVGQSDIRVDMGQQSDDVLKRFVQVQDHIARDADIEKYSPLVTCKYGVVGTEGALESINVETGDYSIFPLEYSSGFAPKTAREIALSSLNADGLHKRVGDTVTLVIDGKKHELTVSGIYQDVTNGGKTAKALLPYDPDHVLWYTISADVKQGVDIGGKIEEYTEQFRGAKVTDLADYLDQTLGSVIKQIKLVTILAAVIALFISVLITSLFLKMLTAKDYSDIAIMKALGFSTLDIKKQYVARTLAVLVLGIIIGTVAANTLGQGLVGMLMAFMGAASIQFAVNPIVSYILCPLALGLIVTITTLISTMSMQNYSITRMITE